MNFVDGFRCSAQPLIDHAICIMIFMLSIRVITKPAFIHWIRLESVHTDIHIYQNIGYVSVSHPGCHSVQGFYAPFLRVTHLSDGMGQKL